MADMPTDFWSGWITGIAIIGFAGLVALVFGIYFGKQPHATSAGDEPVWDGDLSEGSNPAPLWWFWLILMMMVFCVVYLMLYPGLGSYAGALRWSQQSQFEQHHAEFAAVHDPARHALAETPYAALVQDAVAMSSAARLFTDNCAACHGADAKGQHNLFPNLRDGDWLWGNAPEQITQTITAGRTAVMISWLPVLGEEKVKQVASYVLAMGTPQAEDMPGHAVFAQFCVACHGADGSGNPLLGAPRLNDKIWLYGGSAAEVELSIAKGRNGQMPAFAGRLDEIDIRLLVAWLSSGQPR